MFNNRKINELNEKCVNIISGIEQNNKEANKILNLAGNKLQKFEETYEILKKENNNILPNSELFIKSYNLIIEGSKNIEILLNILSDENTNILEKNNIYPMLIDIIGGMVNSYTIMIKEFEKQN